MKLFTKIRELIDEKDCFVCVLIDEVESLTAARKAVLSGTEPSDAIRVRYLPHVPLFYFFLLGGKCFIDPNRPIEKQ
jgi:hypothetical protein